MKSSLPMLKSLWENQVLAMEQEEVDAAVGSQGPTPDTKADPLLGTGTLKLLGKET